MELGGGFVGQLVVLCEGNGQAEREEGGREGFYIGDG